MNIVARSGVHSSVKFILTSFPKNCDHRTNCYEVHIKLKIPIKSIGNESICCFLVVH